MRLSRYQLRVGRVDVAYGDWRESVIVINAPYRRRSNRQILRLALASDGDGSGGGPVHPDAVLVQVIGREVVTLKGGSK